MSTDINTTGKTVLVRLPNFHTLDVRVERRTARVTINSSPINLMDATNTKAARETFEALSEQVAA
jgi:hypothetical protein